MVEVEPALEPVNTEPPPPEVVSVPFRFTGVVRADNEDCNCATSAQSKRDETIQNTSFVTTDAD